MDRQKITKTQSVSIFLWEINLRFCETHGYNYTYLILYHRIVGSLINNDYTKKQVTRIITQH